MQTLLIAGGTGLVGSGLISQFSRSDVRIIVFTRHPDRHRSGPNLQYAHWDPENGVLDEAAFCQADQIINLAGAGVVDRKWTPAYKQKILRSRVRSCALIVDSLRKLPHRVNTVVNASAIGWYGADGPNATTSFVETDAPDPGFLGETCRQWEESIRPVELLGVRLVVLRLGIVLAKAGGAMAAFMTPLRFRVAGIIGSGKQQVSWISLHDLCRMFSFALSNRDLAGVFNAVAPFPVSNEVLTKELARQLCGHWYFPIHVPAWFLRLAMGERSVEVLKSTRVSSKKILEAGFQFDHTVLETALSAELA